MKIAETERLLLRQFVRSDAADMVTVMGDPEVMKYSLKGPLSFDQTQHFIHKTITSYERNGFGLWAVEYKATGHVIGYCGHSLQPIDGQEEVELGYRIARLLWGKGLATEAARAALHYALSTLKLSHIISIIEAENIGSIKVAEKCGLTYHKDAEFHGIPVKVYAITAQDYVLKNQTPMSKASRPGKSPDERME